MDKVGLKGALQKDEEADIVVSLEGAIAIILSDKAGRTFL